jgi:branched-subunit amino acid transport protein AzlD
MATQSQTAPVTQTPRSIRGPLRYQITTSSPQLEAGTKFSIYTRLTNPYDVPVKITAVTTLLPVEFIDVASLEKTQRKRKIVQLINSVQGAESQRVISGVRSFFKPKSSSDPAPRMSTQPVNSVPESDILSESDPFSILQLIRTSSDPESAKAEALRQLHQALSDGDKVTPTVIDLQPGNSVIQVFTLKTSRAIFFPPNIYQSSVRIEYEIDSAKNIDVADYQLNIRAPLKAILYGALTGSFFGFVLKDLTGERAMMALFASTRTPQMIVSYLLSLLTAMMIAGIVVVAFARKKDAQPILSVEDFWGGVFVGLLAGYTGKSFLDKTLGTANSTGPAVPSATPTPSLPAATPRP